MVDPFFILLLMHHLGSKYIVLDKSANINFLCPDRSTVYADICLDGAEIAPLKELTHNYAAVHRKYMVHIFDDGGIRITEVEKIVYIRRKNPKPITRQ